MQKTQLLSIGEASKVAGVSQRTLRYYEEIGLVEPVKEEGKKFRFYNTFHLKLIKDIQQLSTLGFTLDEIKKIIQLKKIFFNIDGSERKWQQNEVPLTLEELDGLREKTEIIIKSIKENEDLLFRLKDFINKFF